MEDLLKSIKVQLYERVSSPLLFSFAISWVMWNYRWLLIATSSIPPSDKALLLDLLPLKGEQYGISTDWYWVVWGLVGPLITSLAYIYLYPLPARKVYEYTRKQQKALKELQTQIDDDTPLTKEAARELRRSLKESIIESEKEIGWRDEQISELKREISDLQAASVVPTTQASPVAPSGTKHRLASEADQLLKRLALHRYVIQRSTLLGNLPGAEYVMQTHYLDNLLEHGYLSESYDDEDQVNYIYVTAKGRAYLVENSLITSEDSKNLDSSKNELEAGISRIEATK